MRRWLGKDLCEVCEKAHQTHDREVAQEEGAARDQPRTRYEELLEQVAQGAPPRRSWTSCGRRRRGRDSRSRSWRR